MAGVQRDAATPGQPQPRDGGPAPAAAWGRVAPVKRVKDLLVKALNVALIVAVAVLTLDVLWGVATRYLFNEQSSWTEELARVLLIWVVMLGGAAAYGEKEHLGLDYFVGRMDPASRKKMRVVADLAILSFSVTVLLLGGYTLVSETFRLEQMLMAIDMSKGYVYLAVPISGVFFVIFGIESLMETLWGPGAQPPGGGSAPAVRDRSVDG